MVCLYRQGLPGQAELLAEIGDLGLFGFEVVVLLVFEDESKQHWPGQHELPRVASAVAEILFAYFSIERLREKVMDTPHAGVLAPTGMAVAFELQAEFRASLAPLDAGKGEELVQGEVAGVRGDDVDEAGFGFRVAESLQSGDMAVSDSHRSKISAVSSGYSRMRPKRPGSSRRTFQPSDMFGPNSASVDEEASKT